MQNINIFLNWPQKKLLSHSIYPIFIPFAGCAKPCIFCAQHLQSGHLACIDENSTKNVLQKVHEDLLTRAKQGKKSVEIAFFGGTFTALSEKDFQACLDFTLQQKEQGHIVGARCSTRPDSLSNERLKLMQEVGFTTIELGVQSFDDHALMKAKRHYTQKTVEEACTLVKQYGFKLGIQLMPGMPGVSKEIFLTDSTKALNIGADFLRMYPCQVIEGTALEKLWQKGLFKPWCMEETIEALSEAWLKAHLLHIPVIRMGLAPERSLSQSILAGPNHPALGNIIQARALSSYILKNINKNCINNNLSNIIQIQEIHLPISCQGYFWGHKQELKKQWENLGITKNNITWQNNNTIKICMQS